MPSKPSPPQPSSPRGRGGRKRLGIEGFGESSHLRKNSLRRLKDLLVRKSQDVVAERVEIGIPVIVMGPLTPGLVNAAVQLYDEF